MIKERQIALIWTGGFILTLLVYLMGSYNFLQSINNFFIYIGFAFDYLMYRISLVGVDLVRALSIGLFVVFVSLCVVAAQRGITFKFPLVVVTILYFIVLTPGYRDVHTTSQAWFKSFVLVLFGSLIMTIKVSKISTSIQSKQTDQINL